jgi:uncharacterized membrane protein (DUF4010 family)
MDFFDLFSRCAVALGIGMLIGLERGWTHRDDAPGTRTAGIRTFSLSGLLGGVFGVLAHKIGPGEGGAILLAVGFATYSAALALFSREENRADGRFSVTTVVAGMVTFALGAYAILGDLRLAGAAAVAALALLALREPLHALVETIVWRELRAALLLLAMTFIVLPLLPDDDIGPLGGINPREIWVIAIVLAAVSFFGYVAVKVVGAKRGVLIAAAAGGLVSSTAVMLNSARQAAASEGPPLLLASGAVLATAVSIARTLAIVSAIDFSVAKTVAAPLVAAMATSVALALLLALRGDDATDGREGPKLRNPFDLRHVLGFAVFLGVLEVVARAISQAFGAAGAVVIALVAGIGDVDAVSVSVTKLASGSLDAASAGLAVMAAVLSNTVSKATFGAIIGRGLFALAVGGATVVIIAAAVAAWWAARMFA